MNSQQVQQAQQFNDNFRDYVRRLGVALGFPLEQQEGLLNIFQNFTQGDRYRLVQNTDRYVSNLEAIDIELRELPNGILLPYMNGIRENWNNMNQQLAQLQILSLLQKKENCEAVIKELLNILNKKITSVNEILTNNLGQDRPMSAQPSAQGGVSQSSAKGGVNVTLNARDAFRTVGQRVVQQQPEAGGGLPRLVGENERRFNEARQRQGGGANDDIYTKKYLKYKDKYLSLKNGIL